MLNTNINSISVVDVVVQQIYTHTADVV